jgi:hypothetical protein
VNPRALASDYGVVAGGVAGSAGVLGAGAGAGSAAGGGVAGAGSAAGGVAGAGAGSAAGGVAGAGAGVDCSAAGGAGGATGVRDFHQKKAITRTMITTTTQIQVFWRCMLSSGVRVAPALAILHRINPFDEEET